MNAGPARALGLLDTAAVVIGAMVGVGIFFTPQTVARLVASGPEALIVWAAAGAVALLGAACFAALGRRTDRSGGQYEILHEAFGPLPAGMYVLCNLGMIQAGAVAVIARIAAEHLLSVFAVESVKPLAVLGLAAALAGAIAGTNLLGVRSGARVQNLTTAAKILALLAIIAAGIAAPPLPPAPAESPTIDPGRVLAGILPAMFAFGGWQQALWVGGLVRDARRVVPRAIGAGVLLVVVLYLCVNGAFLGLLGHEGMREAGLLAADAMGRVVPGFGGRAVSAMICVSALGVLNAQFLTGPHLVQALAAAGRLPRAFAAAHPRFRTPSAAILLLLACSWILLFGLGRSGLDALLGGVTLVDGLFFALTASTLFVFRRREGPAQGPGLLLLAAALLFAGAELVAVAALARHPDFAHSRAWALGAMVLAFLLHVLSGRRLPRLRIPG